MSRLQYTSDCLRGLQSPIDRLDSDLLTLCLDLFTPENNYYHYFDITIGKISTEALKNLPSPAQWPLTVRAIDFIAYRLYGFIDALAITFIRISKTLDFSNC